MPPATNSGQALNNLQSFSKGMTSPEAELQKQEQNLGVQADQQQVQGLQGAITNSTRLLNNVAPSVMGRTANSLVTSAQADRLIGNEQAPINTQLNQENQDFGTANTKYANDMGQAESLAQADATAQENQRGYLQNLYSSLKSSEDSAAQQAEAKRQFDVSTAAAARNAAASRAAAAPASPSFNAGGGGAAKGASGVGKMTRNSGGGYGFSGANGQPVTMAQYLASNGYSTAADIASTAAQLLSQGSPRDKQTAQTISSGRYSPQQLAKMFPQVFGGSF